MASIRVEKKAFIDPRFKLLGQLMGTSRFDARGRIEELWSYCTENQTYYLSAVLIDAITEFPKLHELILHPDVDLGELTERGIRIKGTKGRIEWLANIRKNGRKGGRPKKTKSKPDGNQMETRWKPDGNQERTEIEPKSNPLTLALTLTNKNTNTARTGVRAEYTKQFEELWKQYGKVGKKFDAFTALEFLKLSPGEIDSLRRAISNYRADCKRHNRSQQYFGTFLREDWRIWISAEPEGNGAAQFGFSDDIGESYRA